MTGTLAAMQSLSVTDLLGQHRIILCGGTGGVGKTTLAAALGMVAARRGLRTLVLTIDPARRLAEALGEDSLGATPQRLAGHDGLWAMMLDPRATFDDLVRRHTPDERVRDAILGNAHYQRLSSSVSGSREFMAMEKVLELADDDRWDLLVVDTPPSQQAMDFIDAPRRLLDLLDGSGFSVLLNSAKLIDRVSFGFARRGRDTLLRLFETFTGHQVLIDLTEFMDDFQRVVVGFRERSRRIDALLRGPQTAFLAITVPAPRQLREAGRLCEHLRREGLPLAGVLVNQVLAGPEVQLAPPADAALAEFDADLGGRLMQACDALVQRQRLEQDRLHRWAAPQQLAIRQVPRLAGPVESHDALARIADLLEGGVPEH